MNDGNSFVRLIDAIRAELAALEAEDAEAIENATADKLAALQAVQYDMAAGAPPQRALLQEAQALNAEAALRARAKILTVEKRLAAVSNLPASRPRWFTGATGAGSSTQRPGVLAVQHGRPVAARNRRLPIVAQS